MAKVKTFREFIDTHTWEPVTKGRFRLDLLLDLAERNGIDVTEHRADPDPDPLTRGQIRMKIGNSLRGIARREGHLVDPRGRRVEVELVPEQLPLYETLQEDDGNA